MLNKSPIKFFAKVSSGQGAPQRETDFTDNGFPFIRAGSLEDLLNGKEETDLPKVNEAIAKEYRLKLYQPNTIVFAKSGMSALKGRIYKLKNPCYIVNHLATLELTDKVIPDYVIYTLRYFSPVKLINDNSYPSLKQSVIENYEVPFPQNKKDQLHIANLLSKTETLISQRKESIRLLDQYLKSTFLEMFGDPVRNEKGWKVAKFKDLAIIDRKQVLPSEFTNDDFYIGLEDIEKETGNIIKKTIENAEDLKSSKFRFTPNHILYAKLRPYLNKVALPSQMGICSTDIFPILPVVGKSTRDFICFLMRSKPFVSEMHSKSSGANLPRASASIIENFKTYQPPFFLQTQFAQIVEKTEVLKAQYQQSLQELEQLYGSLSQKAFKGELTIKEHFLSQAAEPSMEYKKSEKF